MGKTALRVLRLGALILAYVWGRPNLSPYAQNQSGTVGIMSLYNVAIPPQFAGERPCPFVGCTAPYYQWMDPVYPEYRDVNFPKMGTWPPPQVSDPAYATWVQHQRQWMPYWICAYNNFQPGDGCQYSKGRPNLDQRGQCFHFDFTSDPNFQYITSWNGVRLVAQIHKHGYIGNEGDCATGGPIGVGMWVKKTTSAYPTPPTWGEPTTLIQSLELDAFGLGPYTNPYGYNILDAEYETLAHPGGGAWNLADIDKYWFFVTQTVPSAYGNANGTNNGSLGIRKVWAALIVNLGGAPAPVTNDRAVTSVIG